MKGFKDALDPINALADASPGFVWRLQTEDGNATALALWWVPAGHIPTVTEAVERTPHSFTFRTPFAPPDAATTVEGLDAGFCGWASTDTPPQPR